MAPVIPARQPAILFRNLYHKTASDIAPVISPVVLFKEATPRQGAMLVPAHRPNWGSIIRLETKLAEGNLTEGVTHSGRQRDKCCQFDFGFWIPASDYARVPLADRFSVEFVKSKSISLWPGNRRPIENPKSGDFHDDD
jgi:hypothetical protein